MNSYLTENQFFAPISSYAAMIGCKYVYLEAHENYQKQGFRNRCIIDSAQGPLTLSIPLSKGKNEKMPIKEVTMSFDTDWKKLHLRSIKSSYGSAPYFDHLFSDIEQLYKHSGKHLFAFNYAILDWVLKFIEMDIQIIMTSTYQKESSNEKTHDARNMLKPNNYSNFNSSLLPYSQVFEENHGYLPNLSILDLLFCTGKASLTYLS